MHVFPMKGAAYFISGDLEQKSWTPSTFLDNKNKNDSCVLYLFKSMLKISLNSIGIVLHALYVFSWLKD